MSCVDVKKDFVRMKELFEDIPWIRILGGEPLLHPELLEIIKVARKTFPNTEIDICTNRILIPQLDDKVWQSFQDNHIIIHISGYEPTYKMMDKISSVL